MISVAMTTYNGENYILEQLQSILSQEQSVDEIVICDDGSSDNTCQMIEDYISSNRLSHVHLVKNKTNLGYKRNFIKAMMLCHGDFVFLSDQDDIWLPNKVKRMMEAMKDERVKVLASSFECVDAQGSALRERRENRLNNDGLYKVRIVQEGECISIPFKELLRENYFQGASLCIRKELVKEICQSYQDYITHDWFINLWAAKYNGMYLLNEVLFQYRIHEQNNLGIPVLNHSFIEWFKQANRFEKRALAFKTSSLFLSQMEQENDSFYLENQIEMQEYRQLFDSCLEILEKKQILKMIKMNRNNLYIYFRNKKTRIMDLLFVITHKGRRT
ncbi:MAG: glycosyltransferase [Bacillota bacterium]|nr:glycosyltransferase [Bacillota bacterium]